MHSDLRPSAFLYCTITLNKLIVKVGFNYLMQNASSKRLFCFPWCFGEYLKELHIPRDSYLYPKITKILFSVIVLSAYLAKKFDVLIVTDSSKITNFHTVMIVLVPPTNVSLSDKTKGQFDLSGFKFVFSSM